jgi:hypothetical protein
LSAWQAKHPGSAAFAVFMFCASTLPCGLWQFVHDIAPSGKRCLCGFWNEAQTFVWQLAHFLFTPAAVLNCQPELAWPVLCTVWHDVQATADRACPFWIVPTCVFEFLWQDRHILSTAAACIFDGFKISSAEFVSACFAPGPWQASQARSCKPLHFVVVNL